MEKEINMLKDLQHHRIVVYHGTRRSNTNVKIFMEYMPGVSNRIMILKCLCDLYTHVRVHAVIDELQNIW